MDIRKIILEKFRETLEERSQNSEIELTDDVVLLETGLDSLGFAVLVSKLEEEFDFDPFVESTQVIYPVTFGEFLSIYKDREKV